MMGRPVLQVLFAAFVAAVLATQGVNARHGGVPANEPLSRFAIKQGSTAKTSNGYEEEERLVVFTEVDDADCIESTPNRDNLDDFYIRTNLACGAPSEGRQGYGSGIIDFQGPATIGHTPGECDWTFDLWSNRDEFVSVNSVPPSRQVGTVEVNCRLDLSKCDGMEHDRDGNKYGYDESQVVTLVGRGSLAWYDNVNIDRLPGFPALDPECQVFYDVVNRRCRETKQGPTPASGDAHAFPHGCLSYRDWRFPDSNVSTFTSANAVSPPQPGSVGGRPAPGPVNAGKSSDNGVLQQPDDTMAQLAFDTDAQPRTYWRTAVLVASGTFSVTSESTEEKANGGTFVYVHGYDENVEEITGEPDSGYLLSPLTATFAFNKNGPARY